MLLDPNQRAVFPLDFEPILREDGAEKNDRERNAAKRLRKALRERYHGLPIILVEDALYANAPHIRQITGYGWRYILNVKPDSHPSLERQFAGRWASGQVMESRITDSEGVKHYFAWTNDLCLCESATRRLWKKLGTKAKLWAMIRSLFSVLEFDSMRALYSYLATLYQIQLE